jgi:hypothetical protein
MKTDSSTKQCLLMSITVGKKSFILTVSQPFCEVGVRRVFHVFHRVHGDFVHYSWVYQAFLCFNWMKKRTILSLSEERVSATVMISLKQFAFG